MRKLVGGLVAALLIAAPAAAQEAEVTDLLVTPLQSSEGMVLLAKHYEVPAGWVTPPHRHSGDVVIVVTSGEAMIELDGEPTVLMPGDAISATPDAFMIMSNPSETERLEFLVHQVSAEDAPYIRVE